MVKIQNGSISQFLFHKVTRRIMDLNLNVGWFLVEVISICGVFREFYLPIPTCCYSLRLLSSQLIVSFLLWLKRPLTLKTKPIWFRFCSSMKKRVGKFWWPFIFFQFHVLSISIGTGCFRYSNGYSFRSILWLTADILC